MAKINIKQAKLKNQFLCVMISEKTDFLIHVNIFDDLLKDGKANPNYFLRDGLHLNGDGYKILKKQIKNYL